MPSHIGPLLTSRVAQYSLHIRQHLAIKFATHATLVLHSNYNIAYANVLDSYATVQENILIDFSGLVFNRQILIQVVAALNRYACNCNGFSNRCVFDKTLYEKTGHGGHCIDCSHNRDGANCERCKDNYYQDKETLACVSCNCDETGSRSLQCNSEGKCDCKPGVTGDKCDHCAADYYDFGAAGCKECNCLAAGSLGNEPHCDQVHGNCLFVIENTFARNAERWTAQTKFQKPVNVQYDSLTQVISVAATDKEPVYFLAPERFLGDQRAAYNQELEFKLRVNERGVASINDVILEGNGIQIYQTIFGQGNQQPDSQLIGESRLPSVGAASLLCSVLLLSNFLHPAAFEHLFPCICTP
ncbi:unnamed protein product [Nezara viridula]|uniref:Uncharacterized protein n=1 Tax=Nezara viridula TaxID=85310 RepID=A0A9P0E783_NEZVI|nr:unnamed protein product [Nezara viridula]